MPEESDTTNVNWTDGAVHLSLQSKGGVGKSLAASILAQYFAARGHKVRCVDTDPVNKTLSQYGGLQVEPLKLLREGGIDAPGGLASAGARA